jgi:acetyl esterase/lipase
VAKQFNQSGIAAFVLKYRTWRDSAYTDYRNIPYNDLQQAMSMIYGHAKEWNIDTAKIGWLGLSAGGHLVSYSANTATGYKPAYTVLVYPVISFMDSLTSPKTKTRNTLLGKNPTLPEKIGYSPELQVSAKTPPAFLIHAEDDSTAWAGNSVAYYKALLTHKRPAQLLLYQKGGHGFALYNKEQDDYWYPMVRKWLALNRFCE